MSCSVGYGPKPIKPRDNYIKLIAAGLITDFKLGLFEYEKLFRLIDTKNNQMNNISDLLKLLIR